MRFTFPPERNKNWHLWFAWYPIKTSYNGYAWLEFVKRRAIYRPASPRKFWYWDYDHNG